MAEDAKAQYELDVQKYNVDHGITQSDKKKKSKKVPQFPHPRATAIDCTPTPTFKTTATETTWTPSRSCKTRP